MVRVVGRGPSLRLEFRLPGADANPYLTIAAALAAGIGGLEDDGVELPAALQATALPATALQATTAHDSAGDRAPDSPVPMDLTEAIARFEASKLASRAFGETVGQHVADMARHELRLARRAVTDWELARGFETA
jgi:glutamine synthetase